MPRVARKCMAGFATRGRIVQSWNVAQKNGGACPQTTTGLHTCKTWLENQLEVYYLPRPQFQKCSVGACPPAPFTYMKDVLKINLKLRASLSTNISGEHALRPPSLHL